jgi:cobalt-zinc-cadmium efflux system membrane fusion protein
MNRINIGYLLISAIIIFQLGCNNKPAEEKSKVSSEENSKRIKLSSLSIKDIGLKIDTAETKPMSGIIKAPAKLAANQDLEAQVGSLIQGRVAEVFVNLGDNVKKGRVLMHLVGLEIAEIKLQFLKAKANLTFAEETLKRQKTLIDQKVGSQKSFLEAQSEYDKALAEYNAEHKKIHSIGLDEKGGVEFVDTNPNGKNAHSGEILPIRSPIDGIIVERNIVIGQLVDASTHCFKIMNNSSLWADAQVYEKDIHLINSKSEITLEVTAFPNEKFTGRIIYIGEVVDEKTRTIKVRALLSNVNRKLKPEMFAEMLIPSNNHSEGVVVPMESVLKDGENDIVFIAINDTTFEKRIVEVGMAQSNSIQILNGIKSGEKIVSHCSFLLKSELKKETFGESE